MAQSAAAEPDSVARADVSDVPPTRGPDRSRLFTAPTGSTLEAGEWVVGATAASVRAPHLSVRYGLLSRLSLEGAYAVSPHRDVQVGAALLGAELQLGSGGMPLVLRSQVELPLENRYGRRLGEVLLLGAGRFGTAERALVLGAGWKGFRGLCRPEWEGCRPDWHGSSFGLVGGYLPVAPGVQLVTENHLQTMLISTTTGIRFSVGGLTAGAGLGCGATLLFGGGSRCSGPVVTASYRMGPR